MYYSHVSFSLLALVLLNAAFPQRAAAQEQKSVPITFTAYTKVEARVGHDFCSWFAVGSHADPVGNGKDSDYDYPFDTGSVFFDGYMNGTPPEWTGVSEDIPGERITFASSYWTGGADPGECEFDTEISVPDDANAYYTEPEGPNERPTASFSYESADKPLTIDFDASASGDPDGWLTDYSWSFGSGGQKTSHTFSERGTHRVTLTVTDNDGAVSSPYRQDVMVEGPDLRYEVSMSPREAGADKPSVDEGNSLADAVDDPAFSVGDTVVVQILIENTGDWRLEDLRLPGGSETIAITSDPADALALIGAEQEMIGALEPGEADTLVYLFAAVLAADLTALVGEVTSEAVHPDTGARTTYSESESTCSIPGKGGSLQDEHDLNKPCAKGATLPGDSVVNSTADAPQGRDADGKPLEGCNTGGERVTMRDGTKRPECTLRAALEEAAKQEGGTITFDIPGAGIHTIRPQSALPPIEVPVILDATTQPGYPETPVVVLDGSAAGVNTSGLRIVGVKSGKSAIKGLAIGNFGWYGIWLSDSRNVTIEANHVGTDAAGAAAAGNGRAGIYLLESISNSIVNNVISANDSSGVYLNYGEENEIVGNIIGTNAAGTAALGNGERGLPFEEDGRVRSLEGRNSGVYLLYSFSNSIRDNVISGNGFSGIMISHDSHEVVGNKIGTNAAGTAALANGGHGVDLAFGSSITIRDNLISGNAMMGVLLFIGTSAEIAGNRVGTNVDGTAALSNGMDGIRLEGMGGMIGGAGANDGNLISGNGGSGISLSVADAEIVGNRIGTNAEGNQALPNGGAGIESGVKNKHSDEDEGRIEGNLISGNLGIGILLENAKRDIIDNRVGTNADGTAAIANEGGGIQGTVSFSSIQDNLISGNAEFGLFLVGNKDFVTSAFENRIVGNRIGTSADGTTALPNDGPGFWLGPRTGWNVIGGIGDERNLISGNTGDGILLTYPTEYTSLFRENTIAGNLIGTDESGERRLPNGGAGVHASFEDMPFDDDSQGSQLFHDDAIGKEWGAAPVDVTTTPVNVISGNLGPGVWIEGRCEILICRTLETSIQGNLIGTDITGTKPLGNMGAGVLIEDGSGITVAGNLVSANAEGIVAQGDMVFDAPVSISQNLIGTDLPRRTALGNLGDGIRIANTIQPARNLPETELLERRLQVVQGNTVVDSRGHGVAVFGSSPLSMTAFYPDMHHAVVSGNRIGFAVSDDGAVTSMGNTGAGVYLGEGARINRIDQNAVAYNGSGGIVVMDGSYHEIRFNSIFSNGGIPIDLDGDGPTENDLADIDGGSNDLTNYPVVTVAVLADGEIYLEGYLNSAPGIDYTVDLFAEGDGVEQFGTAQGFVGSRKVSTPLTPSGSGFVVPFSARFAANASMPTVDILNQTRPPIEIGWRLRGTATHLPLLAGTGVMSNAGTTSEFDEQAVEIRPAPTVTEAASAGDDRIELSSSDGFSEGDEVTICPGCPNEETATVAGFGSLIFEEPLRYAHSASEAVVPFVRAAASVLVRVDTFAQFGSGTAVGIRFSGVTESGEIEVERFSRPPWRVDASSVLPHRWVIQLDSTLAMGSASEIHFYLPEIPNLTLEDPDILLVHRRTVPGAGPFEALETHFDPESGTLVASGSTVTGEFALGLGTVRTEVESVEAIPDAFALKANYPNPFNPQTTIGFALPQAGEIRLVVYDVLGREVTRLVDGTLPAGRHEAVFDAAALPSGGYLYRLEAEGFVQTRRMMLVK